MESKLASKHLFSVVKKLDKLELWVFQKFGFIYKIEMILQSR